MCKLPLMTSTKQRPAPTVVIDVWVIQHTEGTFTMPIYNADGSETNVGKLPHTTLFSVTKQAAQREATIGLGQYDYEPVGRWREDETVEGCLWSAHRLFKRVS